MIAQHGEVARTLTTETKGFDDSRFLMGFHELWASGSAEGAKFELTRSMTSLNVSLLVIFPNGERVTEVLEVDKLVENWVSEITVDHAAAKLRADAEKWYDERVNEQNYDTSSTSRPEAHPMFDDLGPEEQGKVIARFVEEER